MSFCEGCFQSQRGMQIAIEQARYDAKEEAKKTGAAYVLYTEGYEVLYIKAELAQGLNVLDLITPY